MGKITVETCEIEGLKVITPTVFGAERGYFMETYNYNDYKEAGIDMEFVQDNQSASKKGVLRGLHFQINYPQDKLVRVVAGEVYDVAVDLRKAPRPMENGSVCCFLLRTRSSSSSRRISPTVSWCFPTMRSLLTNVPISTIPTMRADFPGEIRTSTYSGLFRKAWS